MTIGYFDLVDFLIMWRKIYFRL